MTWEYNRGFIINYSINSFHLRFTSGAAILNSQLRVEGSGQGSEMKRRPACAFRLKKNKTNMEL